MQFELLKTDGAMLLFPNQRSDRGPDQGSYQGPGRGASDAV